MEERITWHHIMRKRSGQELQRANRKWIGQDM